jgi:hypothetical protein
MGPGLLFNVCPPNGSVWADLGGRLSCWAEDRSDDLVVMPGGDTAVVAACCHTVTALCKAIWVPEALLDDIDDPLILEDGGTDYKAQAVAGQLVTIALTAADVGPIDSTACRTQAQIILTATFPAGQHQLSASGNAPRSWQPVTWTVREQPGNTVLGTFTSDGAVTAIGAPRAVPANYDITITSNKPGAVAVPVAVTVNAAGAMTTVPPTPLWAALP